MSLDWCPGIREACAYWRDAPMLQHTFEALENSFAAQNDASIDACKGLVECVCLVVIDELDSPTAPIKPTKQDTPITELVGIATRLLKLSDTRHRKFADLIKHHNSIANSLRELRNEAGPTSHGKDGFIATLTEYHHRAAIISADAVVTFLHQAYLETEKDLAKSREPYERFGREHLVIDSAVAMQAMVDDEGFLFLEVRLPNGDVLPIREPASRLLYQLDRSAYIEALNAARSVPSAPIEESAEEPQGEA